MNELKSIVKNLISHKHEEEWFGFIHQLMMKMYQIYLWRYQISQTAKIRSILRLNKRFKIVLIK